MDSTLKILLAPHNDDEALFAAYTIMREKPLVIICTDGYIQGLRGDPITAEQRREETLAAMAVLGMPEVRFLGIKDTELTPELLEKELEALTSLMRIPEVVYAPAIQGGNGQHDMVGMVASKLFSNVIHYTTYTRTELWTQGKTEIIPTLEEIQLKNMALDCYQSQIDLSATAPHFAAVRGKSEFYL